MLIAASGPPQTLLGHSSRTALVLLAALAGRSPRAAVGPASALILPLFSSVPALSPLHKAEQHRIGLHFRGPERTSEGQTSQRPHAREGHIHLSGGKCSRAEIKAHIIEGQLAGSWLPLRRSCSAVVSLTIGEVQCARTNFWCPGTSPSSAEFLRPFGMTGAIFSRMRL